MVARINRGERQISGGWIGGSVGLLIVALSACLGRVGFVAWLHQLLSTSGQDAPDKADVIIVLGYALFRTGKPTEPLKGRVAAAVNAFKNGKGDYVILSGAHPGEGLRAISEANAMLEYATNLLGMEPEKNKWIREEDSTSTRENALFSLKIVKSRGWSKILVVTSPFHQKRSYWTFKKAVKDSGMDPSQLSVRMLRTSFVGHIGYGGALQDTAVDCWDWVREILAIAYYWVRGYI
ncbi:hypothetical protein CEUSTIGMA_g2791.t1 [Chlamydomonas eustigma]|uniref:DUF218 domain-containing protein n=1 Tax=Chlamydomonas eustigma TaxID=1157962 RepID=A0A250WWY9_9CHLO|nr:hypothetical protein CEUSTIGMA_g2791.t1 [Chlamydomonas eustigma]|eukprot:GAX75347.1 hypothetical protein CEUSTIGMA_g2791.t1 [Chlamydomonas eustigma]